MTDVVPGQTYAIFKVYNTPARVKNKKNYPDIHRSIPDPSTIAVNRVNVRIDEKEVMSFMARTQKWVMDNF